MGSNVGSDSGSEADIQEQAMKPMDITEIPDSDAEDVDNNGLASASAAKLKGIIEHINADSDDDDQSDQPVDFGEEEEEDESPTPARLSTPENKRDQEQDKEELEDMELEPETSAQAKSTGKKSPPPATSKSRPKKPTIPSPTKTIKKTSTALKGKSKATKKTTATKNSAPLLKSTGKVSSPRPAAKLPSSPKSKNVARASQEGQKKKLATKSALKPGSKGSQKAAKKVESKQTAQKTKTVKPKKTIDKMTKQGNEKVGLKQKERQKTVVKTFSKKSKTGSKGVSESEVSKGRKPKNTKSDSSKRQRTLKKTKVKKSEKKAEDEEKSGHMEVESEDEASNVNSDAEEEEIGCTPKSKLPIIGSLACSSRDANTQALLDHAVQQLGKYRVVNYGPDSDANLHAYIIGTGTKRGWGVLQALVSGARMVSEDWLSSSISEGSWKPMGAFMSDRFGKSPRSVSGVDNRILEGLRIKVVCEGQDASSVRKLVTMCGARVAETRVDLSITDIGKTVDNGTNVTKKWLADSVEAGVAVEYQPYLVESG